MSDPTNEPFDDEAMGERQDTVAIEEQRLLRPLLVRPDPKQSNAESEANIISRGFLLFVGKAMDKAMELDADMEPEHLDPMCGDDDAYKSWETFDENWRKEKEANSEKPSLINALVMSVAGEIPLFLIAAVFESAGPFTSVVLLKYINEYINDPDAPLWNAGVIACIFFVMMILFTLGSAQGFRIMNRMDVRFNAALCIEMSRKTIHLSADGLKNVGGAGVLFQVFQSDIQRIAMTIPMLMKSVDIVMQVIAVFVYMGIIVGWPVVGAIAMFFIVIPFNYQISNSFIALFIRKMIAGDGRTKKVVEILNSIRVIKFYGWEKPFRTTIDTLRTPELEMIRQLMGKMALLMCSFSMATPLVQLVLFVLITVKDSSSLSVLLFFQALGLTGILGLIMVRIPFMYSSYLQLKVSIERIVKVLNADEREELEQAALAGTVLGDVIVKGDYTWAPKEEPEAVAPAAGGATPAAPQKAASTGEGMATDAIEKNLKNVDFSVSQGELAIIVGKVGSGKSSLIQAMLGEMRCTEGSVCRNGSVAYVPQTAWILNATVRNNILVDKPYDEDLYQRVLHATDLAVDMKQLPNGELTEVGEKGINLSGGQRQRLSIARALYQDADIYIFDDPLSALDAHVGRHVFDDAIMGMLATKTRILVTHQMSYLPQATRIYVATNEENDMRVVCEKLPETIPAEAVEGESSMVAMMRAWNATSSASPLASSPKGMSPSHGGKTPKSSAAEKTTGAPAKGQLTVREERQSGQVKAATLWLYLASFGGPGFWIGLVFLHAVVVACTIFGQLWMGWWTAPPEDNPPYPDFWRKYKPVFYLGIYAASFVVAAIIVLLRELLWREGAVNAPRELYDRMVSCVLGAPMSFFDTTPVGRIINRFTKDSEQLDFMVPGAANQVVIMFMAQVGSMIAICVIMPVFIPVCAVVVVVLIFIQPTVATVVLRRLANATQGPISALYSETVTGAASIRCIGLTHFFSERFSVRMNEANSAKYIDKLVFENIRVKVNVVMAFVQAGIMLLIMAQKDSLTPTLASFVVVQSMQLTMYMGYMMFQRGNLTLSLNSIERMREYTALEPEVEGTTPPHDEWPEKGNVEFKAVTAQYRENLPNVLKGIDLSIKAGEKIGVCGRTGSGKSSLLLTMFRMLPILEGSQILIDGIDTASMPLENLRSKLSAIPQEPVLFSGTVRENIDPFNSASDDDLLNALEVCHLKSTLESSRKDESQSILDMRITDGDLSAGQKQLLCLSRAVARNMKILVLDEATSSVDVHTDQLIQETIRSAFANCTVITVAHRLNTIMDSDRVLVLDHGDVAEFDRPSTLLEREDSVFASLVAEQQENEEASP